ncbi:MAG: peptidylprolyl isomerase [Desulfovibrionales bacterium]
MNTNFLITYKKSKGNLYVRPVGDFDGSSAWQLTNLLHDNYDGQEKVFIDTKGLREICPFGCRTFQCRLDPKHIPLERLFFMGDKGIEIAPEGSHVIASSDKRRCGCSGKCKTCLCSRDKKAQ